MHPKDCVFYFIIISPNPGFITCLSLSLFLLHLLDEVLVIWQRTAPSVCFSAAVERILL
jgi:hypothetical protein